MNREIVFGIGGLLIGVLISQYVVATSVTQRGFGMMQANNREDMMDSLQGKSGDDFDRAFIEGMIVHHEGAVQMAEQAKLNAKHQEIKDMSDAIIDAQTTEINQMRMWQKDWGY